MVLKNLGLKLFQCGLCDGEVKFSGICDFFKHFDKHGDVFCKSWSETTDDAQNEPHCKVDNRSTPPKRSNSNVACDTEVLPSLHELIHKCYDLDSQGEKDTRDVPKSKAYPSFRLESQVTCAACSENFPTLCALAAHLKDKSYYFHESTRTCIPQNVTCHLSAESDLILAVEVQKASEIKIEPSDDTGSDHPNLQVREKIDQAVQDCDTENQKIAEQLGPGERNSDSIAISSKQTSSIPCIQSFYILDTSTAVSQDLDETASRTSLCNSDTDSADQLDAVSDNSGKLSNEQTLTVTQSCGKKTRKKPKGSTIYPDHSLGETLADHGGPDSFTFNKFMSIQDELRLINSDIPVVAEPSGIPVVAEPLGELVEVKVEMDIDEVETVTEAETVEIPKRGRLRKSDQGVKTTTRKRKAGTDTTQTKKHDMREKVTCPHCGSLILQESIKSHAKECSVDRQFCCDVCDTKFATNTELDGHQKTVHAEADSSYQLTQPAERTKYRIKWSQADMAAAIEMVQQGTSVRKAAKIHGVPHTTLRDRKLNKVSVNCTKSGPGTLLTDEEETKHFEYLVNLASVGYSYTRGDVMRLASDYIVSLGLRSDKQPVTDKWFYSYCKRWPELRNMSSLNVSDQRKACTVKS